MMCLPYLLFFIVNLKSIAKLAKELSFSFLFSNESSSIHTKKLRMIDLDKLHNRLYYLENDKLVNKHATTGTTKARVVNKPATISIISFNLISVPGIALRPF